MILLAKYFAHVKKNNFLLLQSTVSFSPKYECQINEVNKQKYCNCELYRPVTTTTTKTTTTTATTRKSTPTTTTTLTSTTTTPSGANIKNLINY